MKKKVIEMKELYIAPQMQCMRMETAQMIAGSVLKENTVDIDDWKKKDDTSDDDLWGSGN